MRRWLVLAVSFVLLLGLCAPCVPAADLQLEAKSAVLMDVATGTVLYEENSHQALPPASVTKVMTMLLIMEAIDSGRIHQSDMVTASETAAGKGGSQVYLKAGESMSVTDMLKAIAVSSANDCACAMAEHIAGSEAAFVEMMNRRAAELGMTDTKFVNCTGLDDDAGAAEHKTSAHDIAVMSRQLLLHHPQIKQYTTIWMDSLRSGSFGLANTNKMVRFYPGCTGLKTGFTSSALYCLSASAQREGMELIAVVMGCESSQKRFAACKAMLDHGFASYALYQPEIPTLSVPVKLGKAGSVNAVAAESAPLLIDKGQKNEITLHTQLEETISAPVSKGQRLGTLTVKAGQQVLAQLPLVAEKGVGRLDFGDIFLKLLKTITMSE